MWLLVLYDGCRCIIVVEAMSIGSLSSSREGAQVRRMAGWSLDGRTVEAVEAGWVVGKAKTDRFIH